VYSSSRNREGILVEIILALAGLGIAIWAISSLFSPPRKHKRKDFTLHDRDEATARALGGGSGPPDLSELEPTVKEEKRKKH
jgi:hypothetical protein